MKFTKVVRLFRDGKQVSETVETTEADPTKAKAQADKAAAAAEAMLQESKRFMDSMSRKLDDLFKE